jgi:MOSC domain-containing protein YiiM
MTDQTTMSLVSLQLGKPTTVAAAGSNAWWDGEWTSAIFKQPVPDAVWLGYLGLEGDGVADTKVHGGVDKSVCVYPAEHYHVWRSELNQPALPFGAFGENFTTTGLQEEEVCVGDIIEIGEAVVQVSQPREPCWKPARRWQVKDLAARILETGRTGFYCRTLQPGRVQAGDSLCLRQRPYLKWTIAWANQIMHHTKDDLAGAEVLANCGPLAGNWKDTLHRRCRAALQPLPTRNR